MGNHTTGWMLLGIAIYMGGMCLLGRVLRFRLTATTMEVQDGMNGLICPRCGSDGKGAPMPDEYFVHDETTQEHKRQIQDYGHCFCLPYGNKAPEDRFWSRFIGQDVPGVYDGVLIWHCPDCGSSWPRWAQESNLHLHREALRIIEQQGELLTVKPDESSSETATTR